LAKQTDMEKDYVKKSTLLLACLATLAAGFIGGIVYSAYKTPAAVSMLGQVPAQVSGQAPVPLTGQQPGPDPRLAQERAGAIEALLKETAANPGNVKAWIDLGNNYFDIGQQQESIAAYEKALALDPQNADVWTDMGVMYRRSGQSQKALEAFNKAIAINPRHEVAYFNKGVVLMHDLNDPKGAAEAWAELVRVNPQAKSPGGISIKDMVDKLRQTAK